MNNNWQEKLLEYLEEKIALCSKSKDELKCEFKNDESVFVAIKINVYDIFKTVLNVSKKKFSDNAGNNPDAVKFFNAKLTEIPKSWEDSYVKEEGHGNFKKAEIERIKLETAKEIMEKFNQFSKEECEPND